MATSYATGFDRWIGQAAPLCPVRKAKAVTPSDTKDLTDATGDAMATYARSLYVGGAGNVAVIMASDKDATDSVTVTFVGVPAGAILPIQVRRVKSTSTTATSIVALFDD